VAHRWIRIRILGKAKVINMRIGIREQLATVVLLTALLPLAVLAIAVWINK
jgi:hypothetical protein